MYTENKKLSNTITCHVIPLLKIVHVYQNKLIIRFSESARYEKKNHINPS